MSSFLTLTIRHVLAACIQCYFIINLNAAMTDVENHVKLVWTWSVYVPSKTTTSYFTLYSMTMQSCDPISNEVDMIEQYWINTCVTGY